MLQRAASSSVELPYVVICCLFDIVPCTCVLLCWQAVEVLTEQNMEMCTMLFQKAAVDRATMSMDEAIAPAVAVRKQVHAHCMPAPTYSVQVML